jgi:hypothetical protein
MIVNLIVFLALIFAAVFTVAWLALPALRTWLEKPKYRFQENLRRYDRSKGRS